MSLIDRGYVRISAGRDLHYRCMGAGPPLILLHPSPQCSEAMIPAMERFAQHCTCVAIDTPGYGLSDGIDLSDPSIEDYVEPIQEAINHLGIGSYAVYGAATGAQIAIALGKAHPDRVALAMLDTNGHVSDEEKAAVIEGYMPDVSPQRGGGHLLTYWEMCRRLFIAFPWHSPLAEHRLTVDMPSPEILHAMLLRYLNAGQDYDKAYSAAFDSETADHLLGLTIPASIMRWESSIVRKWTDDLIAFGLPDNFTVLRAGPTLPERYSIQAEFLSKNYANGKAPAAIAGDRSQNRARTFHRSTAGFVHARKISAETGRPLILLHDAGQSSRQALDLAAELEVERPVFAPDLPGHGYSHETEGNSATGIMAFSASLASAIDDANLQDADILGIGFGGMLATQLCKERDFGHLYVVDARQSEPEVTASRQPRQDGGHLLFAWNLVLNSEFFHPCHMLTSAAVLQGDANLNLDRLHRMTHDLLIAGDDYSGAKALAHSFDWAAELAGISTPATLAFTSRQSILGRSLLFDPDAAVPLDGVTFSTAK